MPFNGGWKYYIGNQANLKWTFRSLRPAVDAGINPHQGRQVSLWYMRAWDDLFENGEFEYGFRPVFTDNNYNQYTLDWREFVGLPWFRHSLRVRLYGSVIDKDVDSFFWAYMGGRDGIRGYNYYSIGGRKGAVASVTYRFPIIRNFDSDPFQYGIMGECDLYIPFFFYSGNGIIHQINHGLFDLLPVQIHLWNIIL